MNILRKFSSKYPSNPELVDKSKQDSTFNDLNDQQITPLPEQSQQQSEGGLNSKTENHQSQPVEQKSFFTFKVKLFIGITLFLLFSGIGIGIGLYFRFRTTIQPLGPTTLINVGDGTVYAIGEFELIQKDLFGNDTKVNLILAQAQQFHKDNGENRQFRLLQQETSNQEVSTTSDYSASVNLNQVGVQLFLSSSSDLGIRVDLDAMMNHLQKTDPQISRLLTETNSQANEATISAAQAVQQLKSAISEALSDQVVNSSSIEFKETAILNFAFSNETQQYEIVNGSQISNVTRRMLMIRQLGFLKKIARGIRKVASRVIRPVVSVIRKYGPIIGAVAGGLVGGAVGALGGPGGAIAGAKLGAKLGWTVGKGAQTLVKACVPNGTSRIRCEASGVIQAVGGVIKDKATSIGGGIVKEKCGSTCDKAMATVVKLVK